MTRFEFTEEQLFLTTVMLEVATRDDACTGTGFFVRWPIPGRPGLNIVAIVTCRHVLEGLATVAFKMHRYRLDEPRLPDLEHPVTIGPVPYAYFTHDDPNVDVAALNVSTIFAKRKELYQKFVQPQNFADFEKDTLGPTMKTIFVGYPVGLHDELHALPILRSGPIASIPKVDFNGAPVFLIDAEVFEGSSGSPVFIETDDSYKLVGLVSNAYHVKRDVIRVKKGLKLEVEEHIGIGVVFKVKAITEVLDQMAAIVRDGG